MPRAPRCAPAGAGSCAMLRRSPCVQRRSARRRRPPCAESNGAEGLRRLAGNTWQGWQPSHTPRPGSCFCSSCRRRAEVLTSSRREKKSRGDVSAI
eukprot:6385342-Pyramimonas_sp.AAC.1